MIVGNWIVQFTKWKMAPEEEQESLDARYLVCGNETDLPEAKLTPRSRESEGLHLFACQFWHGKDAATTWAVCENRGDGSTDPRLEAPTLRDLLEALDEEPGLVQSWLQLDPEEG